MVLDFVLRRKEARIQRGCSGFGRKVCEELPRCCRPIAAEGGNNHLSRIILERRSGSGSERGGLGRRLSSWPTRWPKAKD